MYGLNPSVLGNDNPNSPYYESICFLCKQKSCAGCQFADTDADDDKMPEDYLFNPEAMNEMYAELI